MTPTTTKPPTHSAKKPAAQQRVAAVGRWVMVCWRGSRRRGCPSGGGGTQPERSQTCDVVGSGEKVEVGVDLVLPAYACAAAAVASAHQVGQLAFDLRAGRPVVGRPVGVLLRSAGVGQSPLVRADLDRAATCGVGALRAQRAVSARVGEAGGPLAFGVAADRDGDPGIASGSPLSIGTCADTRTPI